MYCQFTSAMKLTRERKIFGAVLVLALGFLGYDQLSGGGATADEAANAASGDLLLASASTSSNKPALTPSNSSGEISLASRLEDLAQKTDATSPGQLRDAFRPVSGWLSKPAPARTVVEVSAADKFVAEHKLTAISTNATGASVAVVDGTLLHVGAAIDGYRLISINGPHALFESSSDGARARLTLANSQNTTSGQQATAR